MLRISQVAYGVQRACLLSGAEVDWYLDGHGALAQAVSDGVILVSSQVEALPANQRQLLYLHELAHLRQLAHRGHDAVADLEAEAWQAAYCWSRGLEFTVRGRACAPLNALALIQGGQSGHPSAPLWYKGNPTEPISSSDSITVTDTKVIEDMTLDSILDAIIDAKVKEILVVCHGTDAGLTIRTHANASVTANRDVLTVLAADHRGEYVGLGGVKIATPIKSEDDVKDVMKCSLAQVDVLRKKMNAVRALNLKHIAFRACDVGASDDTMEAFLTFFGADSASGPTIEDFYGRFPADVEENLKAWVDEARSRHFHVFTDGKVAFGTKWARGISYEIQCRGISNSAIVAWVKRHITTGSFDPANVICHGMMLQNDQAKKDDINIFFIRDADFISRIHFVKG